MHCRTVLWATVQHHRKRKGRHWVQLTSENVQIQMLLSGCALILTVNLTDPRPTRSKPLGMFVRQFLDSAN